MKRQATSHRKRNATDTSISGLRRKLLMSKDDSVTDRLSILRSLGDALIDAGREREAIPVLWQGVVLGRGTGNPSEASAFLALLGYTFNQINRGDSASRAYRLAIKISDQSNNMLEVFFFGLLFVWSLMERNLHKTALTTAYDILRRPRADDAIWGLRDLQVDAESLHGEIGDPCLSIEIAESAAMHPETAPEILAWHMRVLGELHQSAGHTWQAQEYMREAVDIYQEMGLLDEAAEACSLLRKFLTKPRGTSPPLLSEAKHRKSH